MLWQCLQVSQWTDIYKLTAAASMFVGYFPSAEGVIYLRTDVTGGLKPYVGQAKSEARFLARQREHVKKYPNADFEFEILNRGSAKGNFPTQLDIMEQNALNRFGGPTNKSNLNGGTSNAKNIIRKK